MNKKLLFVWQLPQNLLGLLIRKIMGVEQEWEEDGILFCYGKRMRGGISLGKYVILQNARFHPLMKHMTKHEYGHTKQSKVLGPFYLIIVGIPSFLWAIWSGVTPFSGTAYYKHPIEYWADKAGEVDREKRDSLIKEMEEKYGTRKQRIYIFIPVMMATLFASFIIYFNFFY